MSEAKRGGKNPSYGKRRPEATRKQISESLMGPRNPFFGQHHTEDTKKKISEKNKGRTAWNKGIPWPEESRRKMMVSHIGIYPSKETIQKRSIALRGLKRKPPSAEARANMSRAHIGKKPSEETRAKMRKCMLNEYAFSTITPDSKYWAGILIADGNVSYKKGVPITAIHLQEVDRDHLDKKFRAFLGSAHKLGCYINKKTGRISYSIHFSSERIANDIGKFGVVPKKWFTTRVKGGLESDRDTWRGIVDGDGSLGIYCRKTPNGVRRIPYISLTNNLHVSLQFKAFLENTLHFPMPNVVPYKKSYLFSVSDHRALRAIKLLYEGCTVALDRKLLMAKKIMNSFKLRGNSRYITRV